MTYKKQLANILARIQQAQASGERIMSLIEKDPEIWDTPSVIEKYGDAINFKKENWEELTGDIKFNLDIYQEAELLGEELKLGIYRIVEQGVINSIKHGPASRITIRIADIGERVSVGIIDNGPGGAILGSGKGSVIIDAWLSILHGEKEIENLILEEIDFKILKLKI